MLGVPSLLQSNIVTLSCVDNDSQNEDTAAVAEYCFCVETGINKLCDSFESGYYNCS